MTAELYALEYIDMFEKVEFSLEIKNSGNLKFGTHSAHMRNVKTSIITEDPIFDISFQFIWVQWYIEPIFDKKKTCCQPIKDCKIQRRNQHNASLSVKKFQAFIHSVSVKVTRWNTR